jgi:hypothetical protein
MKLICNSFSFCTFSFFCWLFSVPLVDAQHSHTPEQEKPSHTHGTAPHMHMAEHEMKMNNAEMFLMQEAAGTAVNPASASMHPNMTMFRGWHLMTHGYVFLNAIEQTGPRGADRVFSTNHLMLMAQRPVSEKGGFLARAMFSLEPGTISRGYYPLLFQTGETASGRPIIDGQHPHDLFMELSVQYAVELGKDVIFHVYFAPVGDPALGPVAYPHRTSAQELPQAALSHHLQDSTHIVYDVLTTGIKFGIFRLEGSAFHGAEPDEHRWNLEQGSLDSYSTRFTITPSPDWTAQVSVGRLHHPEELEPGNITRSTASITHNKDFANGFWATSFIWGRNHKSFTQQNVSSYLAETLYKWNENYLTGRLEVVDREELFSDAQRISAELHDSIFRIKAFTFGYSRDFHLFSGWQTGAGANMMLYSKPSALDRFYSDSPKGFLFYLRIRRGHSE